MLTRPVAAVKFDLSSTPEQAACAMKIDEGLKTFWNVVEHMQHAADRRQPIHQVEETIFRGCSSLCYRHFHAARGNSIGSSVRI